MSSIEIRLIEHPTDADIDAAVRLLACVFKGEHVLEYATGGNPDLYDLYFRGQMEEAKFDSDGRLYLAVSHEDGEEERVVGAAAWTVSDMSRMWPEAVQKLASEFDERLEPHVRDWWHSQLVPPVTALLCQHTNRVWHLKYLGVLPNYRRKGIGKALVLPLRDQAKAEGWNFSLLTQTLDNVRIYESWGFRIDRTTIITGGPSGDIIAYLMIDGFGTDQRRDNGPLDPVVQT
ncbi:acyl-CoA N-acyltransferase [Pluteus cervinus]|uniref:Acyl-CoA N-acyltransferase n=1 Tax=Pluteus cervinus TaxID=181527 RepID=A0ACD3AAM9_9AGAR|nr:acyl-CoA N-acyltransferase [Pluteus cervinus]